MFTLIRMINRARTATVKISLMLFVVTAVVQVVIVMVSGSAALLADTIHNLADALTAIPLWVAFVVGRRSASRRYTYGYGRIEDLAGLFIVAMIALSAVLAAVESVRRFFEPQPVTNVGSDPQPSSPTGCTPAPTDSRPWQWCSAWLGSGPASRWPTRWSAC